MKEAERCVHGKFDCGLCWRVRNGLQGAERQSGEPPQLGTCEYAHHWKIAPHHEHPFCVNWKPSETVPQSEPAWTLLAANEITEEFFMNHAEIKFNSNQGRCEFIAGIIQRWQDRDKRAGLSTQGTSRVWPEKGSYPCPRCGNCPDSDCPCSCHIGTPSDPRRKGAQGTSEDERALAAAIVEIVFNELDRDCNWLTGEDHAIGLVQKRLMRARAYSLPKEK